ncbi:MAG: alpha-hydroxy-acid oxidizing protein [Chloroflexi bacterium]|nr:alpha-hydroxy-acid oxidizing protein [Chloroflexota bacterium]
MKDLVNIADMEKKARRRLPRFVFDFVAGGAEDEVTLRANRTAFERIALRPRTLVDVSTRDLTTTVLGQQVAMPVLLGPSGLARLVTPAGELAVAKAAGRAGTIFVVGVASTYTIEEVAAVATGPLWFQLYPWGGREAMAAMAQRAKAAGYCALCFTVDAPVVGKRERDIRNGMTLPPRITLNKVLDVARHPGWLRGYLFSPQISLKNLDSLQPSSGKRSRRLLPQLKTSLVNPSASWDDLAWLRRQWTGPLLIKGVMTAEDARQALNHGVDGIVVSNHGGRQLDGLPATIEVLPEIVDAVKGRAEVFVDGGVRRGADALKAVALGAKACLVVRPYWYGLAVGGEKGVARALQIYREEIDLTLVLLGRRSIAEVDGSTVRTPR